MSLVRRVAAFRADVDDLARVDWRHPAWWSFAGGAALLGRAGAVLPRVGEDDQHRYLSANGGPAADNYIGRPRAPTRDAVDAVVRAVRRSRAALAAVAALDGSLPRQPLSRALAWRRGWLEPVALPAGPARVAFVTARGAYLAAADVGDDALATALGLALAGRGAEAAPTLALIDPDASAGVPAAVAVALGPIELSFAQHLHRRAWSRGGGAWLGVGDAPPLVVVTTCHVVVDGYGHALLSERILAAEEAPPSRTLLAAARLGLGVEAHAPPATIAPPAGATPLSFAGRTIDDAGDIAAQAYAFGRALERVFRAGASLGTRRAARFSPTFQIPVAPGRSGEPDRRRRRVVHSLSAVAMRDGAFEVQGDYRARLQRQLATAAEGEGLLASLSLGVTRAPLPDRVQRWLLGSRRRSHPRMQPFEVLAGRGRLSSMRFSVPEWPKEPLFAVSSPTLLVTPDDPLGAVVLSLVHGESGVTLTASGTGVVGTDAGAAAFLDAWCDELHRARGGTVDPRASVPEEHDGTP